MTCARREAFNLPPRDPSGGVRNNFTQVPDIHVEVIIDYGLTQNRGATGRCPRAPGDFVAKDKIAACISPGLRMAVIGSPSHFADRKRSKSAGF